ncbi:MAG: hypothetical protein BAJATHORv1_20308 [Candidatus Thorarchaeota archaeon]|nr:MAG: hypothetical protein BAJATHORv1_20308 [Candidatus Thorarchaeota archaeon]
MFLILLNEHGYQIYTTFKRDDISFYENGLFTPSLFHCISIKFLL